MSLISGEVTASAKSCVYSQMKSVAAGSAPDAGSGRAGLGEDIHRARYDRG